MTRLYIDSGAEYLLPFARKKLEELRTLDILSRLISVNSGEQIYIVKGDVDVIRIRGGKKAAYTSFGVTVGTTAQYLDSATGLPAGYKVNLYDMDPTKVAASLSIPYAKLPIEWQSPGAIFNVSKDQKSVMVLRGPASPGGSTPSPQAVRVSGGVGVTLTAQVEGNGTFGGGVISNGFNVPNPGQPGPLPTVLAGWNYDYSRLVFLARTGNATRIVVGLDVEDLGVHRRIDLTLPTNTIGSDIGGVSPNCKFAWVFVHTQVTVPPPGGSGFIQSDAWYLGIINLDTGDQNYVQLSTWVETFIPPFSFPPSSVVGATISNTAFNAVLDNGTVWNTFIQADSTSSGGVAGYHVRVLQNGVDVLNVSSTSSPVFPALLTAPTIIQSIINQAHSCASNDGSIFAVIFNVDDNATTKTLFRVAVRGAVIQTFTESVSSAAAITEEAVVDRATDAVYFLTRRLIGGVQRVAVIALLAGVLQTTFLDLAHSSAITSLALDYDSTDELRIWRLGTSGPGNHSRFAVRNIAPVTDPTSPAEWAVVAVDTVSQIILKTLTVGSAASTDTGITVPFSLYPQVKPV